MVTIFLLGLLASALEVVGGALIIFKKDISHKVQDYLMALSAGFLLALVFFDLIPESLNLLGSSASLYIVIGFAVLHFFEHTIVGHLHFGEETHSEVMVSKTASMAAISGMLIHAFFDGLSISAAMQFDPKVGYLIFFAIILHKIPEGVTIASISLASKQSVKTSFIALLTIAGATTLGIVTAFILAQINKELVGIAFAFTAGTVCYVGASDLIPEINRSENRLAPLIVLAGMLILYFSQKLIG